MTRTCSRSHESVPRGCFQPAPTTRTPGQPRSRLTRQAPPNGRPLAPAKAPSDAIRAARISAAARGSCSSAVASPAETASAPSRVPPSSKSRSARSRPKARTRKYVQPPPGCSPIRVKVAPNAARGDAMRRSHATRQIQAGADRRTIDRGNGREGQRPDAQETLVIGAKCRPHVGRRALFSEHLRQVGSGGERAALATDHEHTGVGIGGRGRPPVARALPRARTRSHCACRDR